MRRITTAVTFFALCWPAFSQFHLPKGNIPGLPSPTNVLNRGGDFILYLTLASDQGMKALDELAAAFPPEKVAAFKTLSAKYHESAAKRTDGQIDSESFIAVSNAGEEMAKLEADWKSYRKEGAKSVRKAHARLGLMLIADAEASTQTPKLTRDLEGATRTAVLRRDTGAADRLRVMTALLFTVSREVPRQTNSFGTVRHITKNIAEAEKYTLPDDPPPGTVTDTPKMTAQVTKIDAEALPVPTDVP